METKMGGIAMKRSNFPDTNDEEYKRSRFLPCALRFLYIDDDEWFSEIEELVSFFRSGEYREYGCANYIQRNFHDLNYIHYTDCWASRMIRRSKNTCFKSKIHEYLYPQEGECKNLHVVANHSGYIYQTPEDLENHFKRNYPLLLDMMKEAMEKAIP